MSYSQEPLKTVKIIQRNRDKMIDTILNIMLYGGIIIAILAGILKFILSK